MNILKYKKDSNEHKGVNLGSKWPFDLVRLFI